MRRELSAALRCAPARLVRRPADCELSRAWQRCARRLDALGQSTKATAVASYLVAIAEDDWLEVDVEAEPGRSPAQHLTILLDAVLAQCDAVARSLAMATENDLQWLLYGVYRLYQDHPGFGDDLPSAEQLESLIAVKDLMASLVALVSEAQRIRGPLRLERVPLDYQG